MSKKVFMVFNDKVDKLKQALWFVNMFIDEECRDTAYLKECMMSCEYGMACEKDGDGWVWIGSCHINDYVKDMTQVYYEQKNLGEL